MRRSKIFLLNKLSERELDLLKKDLFDHSVYMAIKIKNLNLEKEFIEKVVNNVIEQIVNSHGFEQGKSIGNALKTSVLADLRAEYTKRYPDKISKMVWPDWASDNSLKGPKKCLKTHRLKEIEQFKQLSNEKLNKVIIESSLNLKIRQQKLLNFVITSKKSLKHLELSKLLGVTRSTVTNDIRIIYNILLEITQKLKISIDKL